MLQAGLTCVWLALVRRRLTSTGAGKGHQGPYLDAAPDAAPVAAHTGELPGAPPGAPCEWLPEAWAATLLNAAATATSSRSSDAPEQGIDPG